ncbi:acyl-CoA thioesterase [Solimonas flava]|uniref:acyl-CoA thioesterase n=1 Tax=Solimonas flava TaxID=415849 RepID=UPI00040385B0|nr:acyl-CoA thioesterase [Solimonas flava]
MTLPTAEAEILVPFHDCDPLGIVWHGNYTRYFEVARCALLDRIAYNYTEMVESGYAWPVIDLHLRYVKAIRFNQRIVASATIEEWEHRLKIAYAIRDAASGERLARGHTIQVAVTLPDFQMQYASPDVLAHKLGISP